MSSIKYLNENIAETLYTMRDQHFNSFLDFLKVNPCDSRQTGILITLDFFSEFGESGKLMNIFDLYQTRYDNQKFKSIIKKENNPYPVEILAKYSKETDKQFKIIDEEGFMNVILSTIPDSELPITERLAAQAEYLGYIEYTNPKAKNWGYILDIDTKYSPKLSIYCLDTGNTTVVKISKNDFANSGLKSGQVIKFISEPRQKRKLVDGHWTESNETEPWLKAFNIYRP